MPPFSYSIYVQNLIDSFLNTLYGRSYKLNGVDNV